MNAPDPTHSDKVLSGLLVMALIAAGLAVIREGPYYDNVIEGWRFFTIAFFAGAAAGVMVCSLAFGAAPALKFSGASRRSWTVVLAIGLAFTAAASYLNRNFAAPANRSITYEIDSVEEGKRDRWHITVKLPDGRYQRYLIPHDTAVTLKNEKAVRLKIARGALGFEYITEFEPAGR